MLPPGAGENVHLDPASGTDSHAAAPSQARSCISPGAAPPTHTLTPRAGRECASHRRPGRRLARSRPESGASVHLIGSAPPTRTLPPRTRRKSAPHPGWAAHSHGPAPGERDAAPARRDSPSRDCSCERAGVPRSSGPRPSSGPGNGNGRPASQVRLELHAVAPIRARACSSAATGAADPHAPAAARAEGCASVPAGHPRARCRPPPRERVPRPGVRGARPGGARHRAHRRRRRRRRARRAPTGHR